MSRPLNDSVSPGRTSDAVLALTEYFATRAAVGPALTLVNSIGFASTIAGLSSHEWSQHVPPAWLLVALELGPLVGLLLGRPLIAWQSVRV